MTSPTRTGKTIGWWKLTRLHPATLPFRRASWFEVLCAGCHLALCAATLAWLGWIILADLFGRIGPAQLWNYFKICAALTACCFLAVIIAWFANNPKRESLHEPDWLDLLVFHLGEQRWLKWLVFVLLLAGYVLFKLAENGSIAAFFSPALLPPAGIGAVTLLLSLFIRPNRFHPQAWPFRIPDWLLEHEAMLIKDEPGSDPPGGPGLTAPVKK